MAFLELLIHDPLTRFVAQATIIIIVSRVLGLVARRVGQPMVIAEITAGIMLGPSLFGWLWPDTAAVLFAPNSLGALQLVSQLGLILFMFLIGLELDPKLLRGRGHTSVAISHTSIIVPFALGSILALYLYPKWSSPEVSKTAFILFLGVAMSITAFPVLARILSERRLLGTRVGVVTIACAAVDDVTAWCILAFVVAAARSTGFQGAVLTTALALVYILFMFYLVRPILRRIAARVTSRTGPSQNVVAAVLVLLFLSSWCTELIGIHALFGAFLFGAVLPKEGGLARNLAEKLEDLVLVVLLPLFFAFSGVRTRLTLLAGDDALAVCGLIILVACLGKFGGSALAARFTGLSWRESGALGVLMNTRGLMELIVLNIGLDLGVISPTVFAMMVVMALVTTFMTQPILAVIYPEHLREKEAPPDSRPTPERALEAADAQFFRPLVCVADERSGPGLLEIAAALRGTAAMRVHALHLVAPSERASDYVESDAHAPVHPVLVPVIQRAGELSLNVKPISFVSSDPADDIVSVARVNEVDVVLVGWHKPVLRQSLLSGTVARVLREAPVPVGVVIDRGRKKLARVLVPFVGTKYDRAALRLVQRMARTLPGLAVTVLHVRSKADMRDPDQSAILHNEPSGNQITLEVVVDDSPVDIAIQRSHADYDLVVVGLGREWGLRQPWLGMHSERLIRESSTSLLVVGGGFESTPESES
jgi:Kef-type K+ transport system membrane component KefB/nucleotide-binding universal stress UspA family protein